MLQCIVFTVSQSCAKKFILCINLLFLSTAMVIIATKQLRAYLRKADDGPQMNFSETSAPGVRKYLTQQICDKDVNKC